VSDRGSPAAARVLTVTEAARQAGVPRGVVEGWITNDHLPTVLIDGLRRICPQDLAVVQDRALAGVILTWRRDRQHFERRLRSLRETAGLDAAELAAASGVSPHTIARIEAGRYAPYAATVRRLARGLQLEPEQFVGADPVGPRMVTVAEAATELNVPISRVRRWLQQGVLAGIKVSGEWRVGAEDVAALERSGQLRSRSRRLAPRSRG
jgi:excisionase family DNA binding protein